MLRKTIIYILTTIPCLSLALPATPAAEAHLREIRDSLESNQSTIWNKTWGYANVLSGVSEPMTVETSIMPYWTGNNKFSFVMTRIQYIQLLHDVILAFPHLPFSSSDPDQATIQRTFAQAASYINQDTSVALQNASYNIIQNIKSRSEIARAYFHLHVLRERTNSCLGFWEAGGDPENIDAIIERTRFRGPIPATPSSCQKVVCSTDDAIPYNGFSDISNMAHQTKSILTNVNCFNSSITQGRHAGGKTQLCQLLNNLVNADEYIRSVPRVAFGNATVPLNTGKRYLENMISNSEKIYEILKTIMVLQIDEEITDPSFELETLPALYQPPRTPPSVNCSVSTTATTPGINNHPCNPSTPYTPNESTTLYISELLGLGEIKSVIEPGLPIGLPDNTVLIAGQYINFNLDRVTNLAKGIDRQQRGRGPSVQLALFMSKQTLEAIDKYRNDLSMLFYKKRSSKQGQSVDFLMNKSASLDIISDIRTQNERVIEFENASNKYRTQQLTLLKDSAAWRLHPGNVTWLHSISTISNISLLREIATLLAEIKHIQYHRLSNTQKSTLIAAIITAKSSSNAASDKALYDSMIRDITTFQTGGSGNDPITPPNPSSLQNQNTQALASMRSQLPPPP